MADEVRSTQVNAIASRAQQSFENAQSTQNQSETVSLQNNQAEDVKAATKQDQNFETFLNKAEVSHVERTTTPQVVEAADLIEGTSVYADPGNRV